MRKYWKRSEAMMVKHSDLVICDSRNIETYILNTYKHYTPKTAYISYGAEITPSTLPDNNSQYLAWMKEKNLTANGYYLIVGRFVPENNYMTMLQEFMKSDTLRDLAIVTNVNEKFLTQLEAQLHFSRDPRIKFVGTVYNQELLKKIRENAYGYLHGHEVGGTNPSLLEALGSTTLNLLLDVGFNREVAGEAALYWSKEPGKLSRLIQKADHLDATVITKLGILAKSRIQKNYSWPYISSQYASLFALPVARSREELSV